MVAMAEARKAGLVISIPIENNSPNKQVSPIDQSRGKGDTVFVPAAYCYTNPGLNDAGGSFGSFWESKCLSIHQLRIDPCHTHNGSHRLCGKFPDVVNLDVPHKVARSDELIYPSRLNTEVSPQFLFSGVSGDSDRLFSSSGSFASFFHGVTSRFGGLFRVYECPQDQCDSDQSQKRIDRRSSEHPLSPLRHALLRLEIALGAVLFLGGLGVYLYRLQPRL
jgi:hypothetical protein